MNRNLNRRAALALLACASSVALAQKPPVRILVGVPPGGSVDTISRWVAEKMRASLDQPVVVENRPGASTRIAVQAVKTAAPDGTTLLSAPGGTISLFPHVFERLGYSPFEDFEPVSTLAAWDYALAVPANSPARSLQDFLAAAKKDRKLAFYATPSNGSIQHFLGLLLAREAGVQLEHVGFKGGKDAVNATLGGQVPAVLTQLNELQELHKGGRLRILATFNDGQRLLPEVPTIAELGYKGLATQGWVGLYAPRGTPAAEVDRLNRAVKQALQDPELVAGATQIGLRPMASSPKELDELAKADFAKWRDVVKESGYRAE